MTKTKDDILLARFLDLIESYQYTLLGAFLMAFSFVPIAEAIMRYVWLIS